VKCAMEVTRDRSRGAGPRDACTSASLDSALAVWRFIEVRDGLLSQPTQPLSTSTIGTVCAVPRPAPPAPSSSSSLSRSSPAGACPRLTSETVADMSKPRGRGGRKQGRGARDNDDANTGNHTTNNPFARRGSNGAVQPAPTTAHGVFGRATRGGAARGHTANNAAPRGARASTRGRENDP
jgi:hypothetical protein